MHQNIKIILDKSSSVERSFICLKLKSEGDTVTGFVG